MQLQVWQTAFADRLHIRFSTHHKRCTQWVRHRLILKKLGNCGPARRAQQALLERHLARQYKDRQLYWLVRAQSRVQSLNPPIYTVCAVIDGMDAAKHAWPRSRKLDAKEFNSFNRPRLANTTLILHGHSIHVFLSPHNLSSNSSRSCELVAGGLTALSRSVNLQSVYLHLQADNCSKETKNNGMLRMVGSLVAQCKLAGAELQYLSSGHSHEDIDALFSLMRTHINSNPELESPEAFRRCYENFFADSRRRPHERTRVVQHVTQFRDWLLVCNQLTMCDRFFSALSAHALFGFKLGQHALQKADRQTITEKASYTTRDSYIAPSSKCQHLYSRCRKNWLSECYGHAHIFGIGGPGAPHAFRLRRFIDAGDKPNIVFC